MYLGETIEERKNNCKALSERLDFWGKRGGKIFLTAFDLVCVGLMIGITRNSGFSSSLGVIFLILISPALYKFGFVRSSKCYYLGYLNARAWFMKRGIGLSHVTGAIDDSLVWSYILGGRQNVKRTAFLWILMFAGGWTIAYYVGRIEYRKFKKAAKQLGIKQNTSNK